MRIKAPHSWALVLMSVILATQEAEIRRMTVRSQPRQISSQEPIQKEITQKGLVKWLKAQALSSSPSTTQKRKRKERERERERRKRALGYIWRA
jgi:hypothetical protein